MTASPAHSGGGPPATRHPRVTPLSVSPRCGHCVNTISPPFAIFPHFDILNGQNGRAHRTRDYSAAPVPNMLAVSEMSIEKVIVKAFTSRLMNPQ